METLNCDSNSCLITYLVLLTTVMDQAILFQIRRVVDSSHHKSRNVKFAQLVNTSSILTSIYVKTAQEVINEDTLGRRFLCQFCSKFV